MSKLSVTVGIPTYYGGPSLIETVRRLRQSVDYDNVRIVVTVDGKPLNGDIRRQLKRQKVILLENKERGGQVVRLKQLFSLSSTDILIIVQDDIQVDRQMIARILKAFETHLQVTMIGPRVASAAPETFFESIVTVGADLTWEIGRRWKNGDNYLMASGRTLAFRTAALKRFQVPDRIINSDAYLFLENKRTKGTFLSLPGAVSYNKNVQKVAEYLKQTERFQGSQLELSQFFGDLQAEYTIPFHISLAAIAHVAVRKPLHLLGYLGLLFYVRLKKKNYSSVIGKSFWDTDASTKRVQSEPASG